MRKWFVSILLLVECVAAYLLLFSGQLNLASYLLLHLLASGLFAYCCLSKADSVLTEKYAYLMLVAGFMPVFGMAVGFLFISTPYFSKKSHEQEVASVTACEVEAPESTLHNYTQEDSLQLLHSLHEDTYLDLLLSARSLSKSHSLPLWKEAMNSSDDNARLVGYCFSSELEDNFQNQLSQLLDELGQDEHQDGSHKHLLVADLYWQHLRIGMMGERDQVNVLKKIVSHAMHSIKLDSTNSYSYLLLGELMSHQQRNEEANYFFKKALSHGAPIIRLPAANEETGIMARPGVPQFVWQAA